MAGFNIDVEEVQAYEDLIYPAGKYQVEILNAKAGTTKKGRAKFDMTLKMVDTLPAGEDLDLDENEDPIGQNIFFALYLPDKEKDPKRSYSFLTGRLRDFLKDFDVEPEDATKLQDSDFGGCVGGIVVKHEKMDEDDPESQMRAFADKSCSL